MMVRGLRLQCSRDIQPNASLKIANSNRLATASLLGCWSFHPLNLKAATVVSCLDLGVG